MTDKRLKYFRPDPKHYDLTDPKNIERMLEHPADRVRRERRRAVTQELHVLANKLRQEAIIEVLGQWESAVGNAETTDLETRRNVLAYLESQHKKEVKYNWRLNDGILDSMAD